MKMFEVVHSDELKTEDDKRPSSAFSTLLSPEHQWDVRNFKRYLRRSKVVDVDVLHLVTDLLNRWTSNREWAASMLKSLFENCPLPQTSLLARFCEAAEITSTFQPEMLQIMNRAGLAIASKEPVADCFRMSILVGATEVTNVMMGIFDSPRRRVDCMELQLARRLLKGTASRHDLATCLAVRRQHNIVRPQRTALKRFQNVHPFFTEVEADFLSVIIEKLDRRQDVQVQAILLAEKYLGADTLSAMNELSNILGPIHVEPGTFAKDVIDLAEVVFNEAKEDFVRIANGLNDRCLHEYTQDVSMFKLSRFLFQVCSSRVQLGDGLTAFVAALLSRADGSVSKLSKEYQRALFYGAACVHEMSCRPEGEIRFGDNNKGIERARRIIHTVGRRRLVSKDIVGWKGPQTALTIVGDLNSDLLCGRLKNTRTSETASLDNG